MSSPQGKKIEAYLDVVSPYSFFAFLHLERNLAALKTLGVEVEFIPVFLGGINVGSGNKPPWTLPAKGLYSPYDLRRAQSYFNISFTMPKNFPILTLKPLRALTYVKEKYPDHLQSFFKVCFESLWLEHKDISEPDILLEVTKKAFTTTQAEEIIGAIEDVAVKQKLTDTTKYAVEKLNAFGCPWFWVHDGKGKAEPFFGSDRFHYMWAYLGLPHQNLALLPPPESKL